MHVHVCQCVCSNKRLCAQCVHVWMCVSVCAYVHETKHHIKGIQQFYLFWVCLIGKLLTPLPILSGDLFMYVRASMCEGMPHAYLYRPYVLPCACGHLESLAVVSPHPRAPAQNISILISFAISKLFVWFFFFLLFKIETSFNEAKYTVRAHSAHIHTKEAQMNDTNTT